jgi:hypothetical protein
VKLRNHYYIDSNKSKCCVYIRKNASSIFKKIIIDLAPKEIKTLSLSHSEIMFKSGNVSLEKARLCCERVFVLRDPAERVISGFLNRLIMKVPTASGAGVGKSIHSTTGMDPLSVTFSNFVSHYLSSGLSKVDSHFATVVSHLGPLNYTKVIFDKYLYDDARWVFGDEIADKYFFIKRNSTGKYVTADVKNAFNIPASELFLMFQASGVLPSKESFMDSNVVATIKKLYSADYDIYTDYISRRSKSGNLPVNIDMTNSKKINSSSKSFRRLLYFLR